MATRAESWAVMKRGDWSVAARSTNWTSPHRKPKTRVSQVGLCDIFLIKNTTNKNKECMSSSHRFSIATVRGKVL